MAWEEALRWVNPFPGEGARPGRGVLPAATLRRVMDRERARAERTGREFSLVAFDLRAARDGNKDGDERGTRGQRERLVARVAGALSRRVRRTDAVGWLDGNRLGVVLSDTAAGGARSLAKETAALLGEAGRPPRYTVYGFPPKWRVPGRGGSGRGESGGGRAAAEGEGDPGGGGGVGRDEGGPTDERLEPLLASRIPFWKRAVDVVVACAALIVLGPLILVSALLIKLFSPGPALFRQTRIGLGGRPFELLKLRSMRAGSDAGVHRRHLSALIGSDAPMEKLQRDPRVFALGSLLRRTCIDELPQLVNVLRGEMSLVGPRPCLPYEAEEYARWHARRFDIAPGMTGLWQVSGKNSLTFAKMVRLDIAYARTLSPWLDLTILLKTPLAVLAGILPGRGGGKGDGR